jgi:hypothetical protein
MSIYLLFVIVSIGLFSQPHTQYVVGGLIELRDGNNNHMACLDNILDWKCLTTTTQEVRKRANEI